LERYFTSLLGRTELHASISGISDYFDDDLKQKKPANQRLQAFDAF
jgi:hypothetical protein